jgi:lysophospholipase L1-like esterase
MLIGISNYIRNIKKLVNITDDFEINSGNWIKAGPWVTSSIGIDGIATITPADSNVVYSGYKNKNAISNNFITSVVTYITDAAPQFHLREASASEMLVPYAYNDAGTGKIVLISTGSISHAAVEIPNFNAENIYQLVCKVFGNRLHLEVYDSNGYYCEDLYITDDALLSYLSNNNGLGASGACVYDNYTFKGLDAMTNFIAIGDSTTQGSGLTQAPYDGWVQQLQYTHKFNKYSFVNAGVNGERTDQILARLSTDVIPHYMSGQRNIVNICAGLNDLEAAVPISTIKSNIESIINALRSNGFNEIWLCSTTPIESAGSNVTIKQLNAELATISTVDKFIDLYSLFVTPGDDEVINTDLYIASEAPTRVHHSNAGGSVWAAEINSYL